MESERPTELITRLHCSPHVIVRAPHISMNGENHEATLLCSCDRQSNAYLKDWGNAQKATRIRTYCYETGMERHGPLSKRRDDIVAELTVSGRHPYNDSGC
ncbi:hypothetical protein Pmar_PMAR000336 [Perkinsus marinus ATCC 50983]|uniref:Uncharacterized protein n=1 Tax=Perkinsus marinus (strain ATCC 50983 / TXsc) TaxID=423536 RepID=C5KCC9_PERM5|nr:hypothetical protein Pmar_PMAR000336 [Perkinsus marinus ATCC 50983]EER17864.1 hypothetical protein Pmar_PMAR000336 [Perkinsus marinus ATCC 50983]|eukprot:XP_002786068.1 hypothetical protein Pmar_PMAR000336 [Perkinsus marinus ATCC 50983]